MKPLNLCWTSWFLTCGTLKASHALKTASSCCPWTRSYLSLSAPALFSLSSLPAVDYKGEAHALQAGICESLTLALLRWLGRSWKKKNRTTKHCDTVFFNSRNWNSRMFDEHVGYFRIHRGVCVCHLMAAGTKKPRRRKLGQTPAWVSKWDWGRYSETSWEFRNTNKWEMLTKCERNGKERGEARASFALNAAVRLRSVGFDQINQKKEKIISSYITSLVWIAVFCSPSRFDLGAASVLAFTGGRQIPSRRASNTPWSRSHVNKELRTWHCLWPALLQRWYVDPITTCKWPPHPCCAIRESCVTHVFKRRNAEVIYMILRVYVGLWISSAACGYYGVSLNIWQSCVIYVCV